MTQWNTVVNATELTTNRWVVRGGLSETDRRSEHAALRLMRERIYYTNT